MKRGVTLAALSTGLGLLLVCGCRQAVEVKGQPKATPAVERPDYLGWDENHEPTFEVIPGTGIRYMKSFMGKPVGPKYDICKVGKRWYWAYKGHWFYSRKSWRGDWEPAKRIPRNFLKISSNHEMYRLAKLHPNFKK